MALETLFLPIRQDGGTFPNGMFPALVCTKVENPNPPQRRQIQPWGSGPYYVAQAQFKDGVSATVNGYVCEGVRDDYFIPHTAFERVTLHAEGSLFYSFVCYQYKWNFRPAWFFRYLRWTGSFDQRGNPICVGYSASGERKAGDVCEGIYQSCLRLASAIPDSSGYGNGSFQRGTIQYLKAPDLPSVTPMLDSFEWWCLTEQLEAGPRMLASEAYIGLSEVLPQTTTNSIMNVLEIASTLHGFSKGDFGLPKTAGDAWLTYRYVYTTSKADLEEYISLTNRLASLATVPEMTLRSAATRDGWTCRATAHVPTQSLLPHDTASWLKANGFRFNLVNAWDMVPYSFVVDWFLHISDFLENAIARMDLMSIHWNDLWYSFSKNYDWGYVYWRVRGEPLYVAPMVSYSHTSGVTTGKRLTDSLALFLC